MKIKLWKGYHGKEIYNHIRSAWENDDLLVLHPPKLSETDYLSLLPEGDIETVGEWDIKPKLDYLNLKVTYSDRPIFGVFSTGTKKQKLVLYSKNNITSSLKAILSLFDMSRIEEIFTYPQPFHTFGLILGYCHSIIYSKRLTPLQGKYSEKDHELWINKSNSKLLTLGTPTHFKDLIKFTEKKSHIPSSSYSAIIGAAKVEHLLWKSLQTELKIEAPSIGYGATEASPGITHLPPGMAPKEDGEVGFFLNHIEQKSITENGIEFSGPNVCLATIQEGKTDFPKTILIPDRLRKRQDGVMLYEGRVELQLNRGGEKFLLEEIESILKEKLGLDSICVSLPHERLGEELGMIVKTDSGKKNAIYKILKESFGRDFDPTYCLETFELPLNSNLKSDRTETHRKLISEFGI